MISNNQDLKECLMKAIEFHRIAQSFEAKGMNDMGKLMREKSQKYLEYYNNNQETEKLISRPSDLDLVETGIIIVMIVIVVFADVIFKMGVF